LNLGNLDKISTFLENASTWKLGTTSAAKEIYNMVYNLSKVYPNKTIAGKFQKSTPKHWVFSLAHRFYLEESAKEFYREIASMVTEDKNSTFNRYLNAAVANLTDLVLFVEQIPAFAPLVRDGVKYWTLYSEDTVQLLYQYSFLSTVHEYVILANDRGFVEMRAEELKKFSRELTESEQLEREVFGDLEEDSDYGAASQIRQVHIVETDSTELKKLAAKWLFAVLVRERDTKTAMNRNYAEIMESTMSLKYKDKKDITDYLAALSRDERRVEQTLRSHKIGRWNVGMQKGLFQYEKSVYDKEIAQWHTDDDAIANAIQTSVASMGGEDVEDLERDEHAQQSAEYDQGDGWDNLDEDYTDGVFYEEDAERGDYDEY